MWRIIIPPTPIILSNMKLHSTNQILNLNEVDKSDIETPNEEVECYLGIKRPRIITSLLSWWQVSMVHNTAMPVFSSSAETVTKCCICLQPEMIEALQILKYLQWKSHLEWMEKVLMV